MPTVTMQAPTPAYTKISTRTGNTYNSDSTGLVSNVDTKDIADLQSGGFTLVGPGYATFHARMLDARNIDGSVVAAAASSGKFGVAVTLGTSMVIVSEAANNATKTDSLMFDITLPASFPAGHTPSIIVNQNHVIGSGTLSTHTVAAHLYGQNDDGTQTADLVSTSAQNTTAAAGDLTFATSAGLQPGQRVVLELVMVLTETASSNVTGHINSVRFT